MYQKNAYTFRNSFCLISGLIACVFTSFGQDDTFDSGSDGSDGALFIKGTFAPVDSFDVVYDAARDEIVGFGGGRFTGGSEVDDTYLFDGQSWRQVARDNGPSDREFPNLAYDSVREEVVLFGGDLSETDTWIWDGTAWTEITPVNTPPNYYSNFSTMDYHPPSGRTVLVVRESFSSQELVTWTFDGSDWTETAAIIPRNNQFQMVYDPGLQQLLLLMRVSSDDMETWAYNGTNWSLLAGQGIPHDDITEGRLVYDGRIDKPAFYGEDGGFAFDGTDWAATEAIPQPFEDRPEQIVYMENLDALIRINGRFFPETGGSRQVNDTWAWRADGTTEQITNSDAVFDMTGRPNGVWNFTTIDVGPNVTLTFDRNDDNTPIRWLASGDVNIDGFIDISGTERIVASDETFGFTNGFGGRGGPGGFDGATSAPLGTAMNVPGDGPGGGFFVSGISNSDDGKNITYTNLWLHPLIGGSGGGSFSSSGGGSGGGALLIASSGEISVEGSILARPDRQGSSSTVAYGAGGSVLLRAQTISGSGYIDVSTGRLRVEAWDRPLYDDANLAGNRSEGPPLLPVHLDTDSPKLWVDSINGVSVTDSRRSTDSLVDPDLIIEDHSGDSTIIVKGENIPSGTDISITVSLSDGTVLEPDPASFNGTQASFTLNLPDGFGAIAATANFPVQN